MGLTGIRSGPPNLRRAEVVRDDRGTGPALKALSRRARTLVIENLVSAATVIVGLVI
jgi:hypothetical protein